MQPFKNYIDSFSKLLANINPLSITSNGYASNYLSLLLQHKLHYLHIYATILEKAFAATNNKNVCLLDFGTGNGLLAIFAKYCGIQQVHASDVSATFLLAAQQLSNRLNIQLDGWIIGNENTLPKHFANRPLHIVVASDVIEHVYDIDNLFNQLNNINPKIISVFTTASVAENPIKCRVLKKLQLQDEFTDSNAFESADDNPYAGCSFLSIRKKLIKNYGNNLSVAQINELATITRGLIEADIAIAVNNYLLTGNLPKPLLHPTNTCNPITGSWTERLLTIKEYKKIYTHHNNHLLLHMGFYNAFDNGLKNKISYCINLILQIFGNTALPIAPFIILESRPIVK